MPKGRYGVTRLYQLMRAAERFSMNPWELIDHWTPGQQQQAIDFEVVREAEEALERRG